MFVVIFRARIKHLDPEYYSVAKHMRELALSQFGCLEFQAVCEGDDEVALSYWPSLEHIRAWKNHGEHLAAQQLGKEKWYAAWSVQIAEIVREYRVTA